MYYVNRVYRWTLILRCVILHARRMTKIADLRHSISLLKMLHFCYLKKCSLLIRVMPLLFLYRLEFGKMKTLIRLDRTVLHMEWDLVDMENILLASAHALHFTDRLTVTTLVGSAYQSGYLEGRSTAARFSYVPSFAQLNATSVVLADAYNHCIRLVHRDNYITQPIAGSFKVNGSKDGTDALFDQPFSIIKDFRSPIILLIADKLNHALRQLNIQTREVKTIIHSSNALHKPRRLRFDSLHLNLLISNCNFISKYDLNAQYPYILTGTTTPGFKDGAMAEAEFNAPFTAISMSPQVMIVAENDNDRLRIINTATSMVTSICTGEHVTIDGSVDDCALESPIEILEKDGMLYIGQCDSIRTLPCN